MIASFLTLLPTLLFFNVQGPKGSAGMPGPVGVQGPDVSLIYIYLPQTAHTSLYFCYVGQEGANWSSWTWWSGWTRRTRRTKGTVH